MMVGRPHARSGLLIHPGPWPECILVALAEKIG
jgi:hypothetical protein